jgi:hypothetical protein
MTDLATNWPQFVRDALPRLLENQPLLTTLLERAALLLHGSLTLAGADDEFCDIDLWLIASADDAASFDQQIGSRFVQFKISRDGHFQVESVTAFQQRVNRCDLQLIAELSDAVVLSDPAQIATHLLASARKPMPEAVRFAWFRYHYIEMRSEHRGCDGAISRGHPIPLLLTIARTLQHAMQAAMVLDRRPYRYGKWLAWMAEQTPTGAKVVPLVNDVLHLVESGALRHPGPEATHPLTQAIKRIRITLIESACAAGIDAPWLTEWWLHIDKGRQGIHQVSW